MRMRGERRAAWAALAAMSGVGFASGRALALFFGQLKSASWVGIFAAGTVAGVITGYTGKVTRPADAVEQTGEGMRDLLAALVCVVMLSTAGRVGALTLPMRHGYAFGAVLAVILAALLQMRGGAAWPIVGAAVSLFALLFYGAMALDARPVRMNVRVETDLLLAGSLPHALLLALPYGALTGCVGRWGAARFADGTQQPWAVALRVGLMLCALMSVGNLALMRGGDSVLAQPLPWVLLSARWGLLGFWLCAAFAFLCAVATLSAASGLLISRLQRRASRAGAVFSLLSGVILFAALCAGQ